MNKKVLSAILFSALFAGTGTFTSCIDNDEPAGIEELRGAKAELIRAKVAVEQAEATYKLAQAELEKAKAAKETALAKIEEANVEAQRLANELTAAENEGRKAQIQAELEAAKLAADKAKLEYQEEMLDLQASLADAQRKYEITMKQIEIAKALMNEGDLQTIAELEGIVEEKQTAVETAAIAVKAAENDLYEATMAVGEDSEYWVSKLELDLKYANANLTYNKDLLAKYEGYVENLETADWLAEIKAIEVELDSITKAYDALEVEKTKELNSEAFKAQKDSVTWAFEAYTAEKDTLKDLALAEAVVDTLMYYDNTKDDVTTFNFAEKTSKFDVVEALAGSDEQTYLSVDQRDWAVSVADSYAGLIAGLEKEIAGYTTEYKYWLDSIAANDSTRLAGIKAEADSAIVYWQRALEKYVDADKTVADKKEKAEEAMDGTFANAKAMKDAAKALLDYYTAAQKNGATFNNLFVENGDSVVVKIEGVWTEKPVMVAESPLAIFADTTKTYYAYKNGVNFFEVATEADEAAADKKGYDADGKVITKKNYKFAFATLDPEVGTYSAGSENNPNEETLLGKLQKTSNNAFGFASYYVDSDNLTNNGIVTEGYLHKQPTSADAKYVGYKNAGKYGTYLASLDTEMQFVAKNYVAIIADLNAAVTKAKALVAEIVAEVETEAAEVKTACEAYNVANGKFELYTQAITDKYDIAQSELGGKERALNAIKNKLAKFVNEELENIDYSELEEWLAEKIKAAEYDVIAAEEKVVRAENAIQRAKDGKYTTAEALAQAEEDLDAAIADLEKAQAELDEAMANLKTALEIMAGTAE